ncbi:MAG: response regulator [Pirellulales bacterium]
MRTSRNVLVVDDNPGNREIIHEILDGHFTVIDASNGTEALAIAARCRPPIVLLDVMLPDIDGYEVCRRLRRSAGTDTACIIMVSAKAMPSEQQAGFEAGADSYLTKPFDDDELWEAIHSRAESREVSV